MLRPGRYSLAWSHGGEPFGSISLVAQADGVRLLYWLTEPNGKRINIDELVPFRYTATRFGGRRQWLTCLRCGRRCRRIFAGCYFRCRQCDGLKYASRNESPAQCAMNRADRIANRLHDLWKGTTKAKWEFPPKPPRMRWRTYLNRVQSSRRLEREAGRNVEVMWLLGRLAPDHIQHRDRKNMLENARRAWCIATEAG